ncbi:MAG: 4-hydroxy-3-methylbut-2-enyl diphosphate reductase [Firmicutes bacterium HGW-Firmicutes-1]|jgi:4-hydroxy-3-methylbut-2-enyl diphosphate reductase|nr:MAG: 4-hydroxy-3-methylbut-2-enyl diphosphate reductase [Firmicutes bacterium HGW-Firmicutes-1]
MEIIVAKTAGFCFGVDKAIQKVNKFIGKEVIYTYGPIIHNQQVVKDFESKGVKVIDDLVELDNMPLGTIIIRSHGAGKNDIDIMRSKGFKIIDATCPYVKRIHRIVEESSQQGNKVIIIGSPTHPEVIGIKGWSSQKVNIIENIQDIDAIVIGEEDTFCLVTQTTFNFLKYKEIVNKLQKSEIHVMIYETICSATEERQMEAIELSKIATKMIVIGGKHSSNTQKLYHICKTQCKDTYYIETAEDLVLNVFDDNDIIGITAGASTPKNIIEEVILNVRRTKL